MNHRLMVALAIIGVAACLVAGTGSAASTRQQDLAFAASQVAKYSAVPAFNAPGPAIDADGAKGKSIYLVPAGTPDIASVGALDGGIRQAAKAVGIRVSSCPNNGTVAAQQSCLQKAAAKKPSLVILIGSSNLVALSGSL